MTTAVDSVASPLRLEVQPDPPQPPPALSLAAVLAAFRDAAPDAAPAWLKQRRQAALASAVELGFPTAKDEEWRFTPIAPLLELPLHPARQPARQLTAREIAPFTFGLEGCRLVFVDGYFCAELSVLPAPGGDLQAVSLRAALAGNAPELEPHLARIAGEESLIFTALNTAFFRDGALVCAAPGKAIAQPVHLLFIATAGEAGATAHVRNLIVAGARSEVKILETYVSLSGAPHVTNTVTELVLGADARVDHCKIQEENHRAIHIAAVHARQDRGSHWSSHSVSTGAHLARHQIQTVFHGENGLCLLNGLYLVAGGQLADYHTVVDHARPRCESHEFYHGILSGSARGVFNGKILVRQDAQKTNAKQTNRNLLLSDDAVIDTKPQLEIFADDVKCTHGATVGQMDEEALFYLRSRGIGLEHARRIMIRAFASDVVDRIPLEPVRAHLNIMLTERFKDKA
jgi:Fe-S cluster assembly protein SufD